MTHTTHLALVPRDGIFCKDGRGWHTSASGRGHALDWPWPSTVLGALRAAWGRGQEPAARPFSMAEWQQHTADVALGRTLVLRRGHGTSWGSEHSVWPVPADALWVEGHRTVQRIDPVPAALPTLGRGEDTAREALWRPMPQALAKPRTPPRWWSSADFASWLAGESVGIATAGQEIATARRVQVHVGIHPEKFTADEGVIFSHDVVETLEREAEWAVGVEVTLPGGATPTMAKLGSDGRLAAVEALPASLFDCPKNLRKGFGAGTRGLRLVAVTPLCFARGWLPDGLEAHGDTLRGHLAGLAHEVVLRAAFVPRPMHVSGWDMAQGAPKATSRMVPPGAVYFFERTDGQPFTESDACALWLAAQGSRTGEGFGRVVPGIWSPSRSNP